VNLGRHELAGAVELPAILPKDLEDRVQRAWLWLLRITRHGVQNVPALQDQRTGRRDRQPSGHQSCVAQRCPREAVDVDRSARSRDVAARCRIFEGWNPEQEVRARSGGRSSAPQQGAGTQQVLEHMVNDDKVEHRLARHFRDQAVVLSGDGSKRRVRLDAHRVPPRVLEHIQNVPGSAPDVECPTLSPRTENRHERARGELTLFVAFRRRTGFVVADRPSVAIFVLVEPVHGARRRPGRHIRQSASFAAKNCVVGAADEGGLAIAGDMQRPSRGVCQAGGTLGPALHERKHPIMISLGAC
jgi:hypothetical protein